MCVMFTDLEEIFGTSTNYDQLLRVWTGWRNVTGRRMKALYSQLVDISNAAVRELGIGINS